METPIIPDWHSPHNEACDQNLDIEFDCTCPEPRKVRRNYKPYRTCKVTDPNAPNGVRPDLILEVHPNGRLVVREKGRRVRYETTVGQIYNQCRWRDPKRAATKRRKR